MFLLIGCSENSPNESEKNYSGITRTSADNPEPVGEIDPDDWYYQPDTSAGGVTIPTTYSVWPAYPNPTTRYTTVRFSMPQLGKIKIWIDDPMANKETIILDDTYSPGIHEKTIDLFYGNDNYDRKEGIIRAFIDFISASEIPLIHGDIQIIK